MMAPKNQPQEDEEDDDESETRIKAAERKRKKEKQRRSDLTTAFDELAAFMVEVEPNALIGGEDADAGSTKKKKKKSGGEDDDDDDGDGDDQQQEGSSSRVTRLDIIGHALRMLKRLHSENEQNKRLLESLTARRNINDQIPSILSSRIEDPYYSYYPSVARAMYPSSYVSPPTPYHPATHLPSYYQGLGYLPGADPARPTPPAVATSPHQPTTAPASYYYDRGRPAPQEDEEEDVRRRRQQPR